MAWIDTHAHLEDAAFEQDRAKVLARARNQGIDRIINAGSTLEANPRVLQLAQQETAVFAGIGIHPHEFSSCPNTPLNTLREQLCQEKVVALGEIGLDYHVFPDFPLPDHKAQQAGFVAQLQLARLFELPVILHVREAFPDALAILREFGPLPRGGVMHCYAGGKEYLPEVMALGLAIGVGGTLTYPKAESVRQMLPEVPAGRLLLETDSPYLPPQPHRGKRNEPAYMMMVAEQVAGLRGCSLEQLQLETTAAAESVFAIAPGDPGVVTYEIKGHLYVNLTNRCTANCGFCPRHSSRRVQGFELTLRREPSAQEILTAIGDPRRYQEIVF